jgi:hypothetical protein
VVARNKIMASMRPISATPGAIGCEYLLTIDVEVALASSKLDPILSRSWVSTTTTTATPLGFNSKGEH